MRINLFLEFQIADVPCKLIFVNPYNDRPVEDGHVLQHQHTGMELHCVRSGELVMSCIEQTYTLTNGQLLLLPSNAYHYVRSASPGIDRMDLLLEVGNYRSSRNPQATQFLKSLSLQAPLLLQTDTQPALSVLLAKIRSVTSEFCDTFVQREHLKALSIELALLLGIAAQRHMSTPEASSGESENTAGNRYIVDEFFNHSYRGTSRMETLAEQLNISVRQTGRELKKAYGKGFRKKINEQRLTVAIDLLQNTGKSIVEISEILGYSTPANFSSFVKRQTGHSPSQIRKARNLQ